jgi:3-methylcrotonyl-CoA carboxylase alpha subunit
MEAAGVPVIPGWSGDAAAPTQMRAAAEAVGYPLLVKAAAGGGGKGMRLVEGPGELQGAVESAQREAEKAFGDARVFLERYLTRPRHVEIQIFGDARGGAVHLFERECSVQRRHQKIAEESPSPGLDADLRARMGEAAVRAAQAIGYENAGTVEFILDAERSFYFLEVNTRLQVEHPITELVTGRDLVRAQLLVAAGEPLPFRQEELAQRGHALECRIYAEDPENGFLPSTGTLRVYREPSGPGVRVDSGVREGGEVSVHYDPLLAKLIVHAEDRERALERMDHALAEFVILGVRTNIPFLRRLIRHPAFRAGELHTHFLEEHRIEAASGAPPDLAFAAAALALSSERPLRQAEADGPVSSPWHDAGARRLP